VSPGPADPIVVAVVVTHVGHGEMLSDCIASVLDAGGISALIIVDNSPGSVAIRTVADVGNDATEVVVVENRGFGAAVNAGIQAAGHCAVSEADDSVEFYAVLNDDVTVEPGWLTPLLADITTDERIGGVQPKILLAGTGPVLINSVGVVLDPAGAGSDIGLGEPDGPSFDRASDISIFTGGAVLLSAPFVADLGGFDERYFLYYEDVDLALRGAERGWRFRCVPDSKVHHAASSTTRGLGDEVCRLQERNRLWTAFRFGSASTIVRALWLSMRRLRHEPRRIHARALAAGLAGAPTRLFERRRAAHLNSPS